MMLIWANENVGDIGKKNNTKIIEKRKNLCRHETGDLKSSLKEELPACLRAMKSKEG